MAWECTTTHLWADAPIQNRRPRRCGGGLGNIFLHYYSACENRGERARASLTVSAPCSPQPHVGVLTRSLPEVLWCCDVVERQLGVADAVSDSRLRACFPWQPFYLKLCGFCWCITHHSCCQAAIVRASPEGHAGVIAGRRRACLRRSTTHDS